MAGAISRMPECAVLPWSSLLLAAAIYLTSPHPAAVAAVPVPTILAFFATMMTQTYRRICFRIWIRWDCHAGACACSASEDMDAKIRKITDVFGLSADPEDNDAPSFPELLKTIADLHKLASDCRDDLDVQTVSPR